MIYDVAIMVKHKKPLFHLITFTKIEIKQFHAALFRQLLETNELVAH